MASCLRLPELGFLFCSLQHIQCKWKSVTNDCMSGVLLLTFTAAKYNVTILVNMLSTTEKRTCVFNCHTQPKVAKTNRLYA